MADGAQVHADLMRAPGVDRHLAQREPRQMMRARDPRDRVSRACFARADIFCRFAGSRPIAASMRRPACTTPQTSAMYSFSTSRSWNCRASSWCAASFLATTITPDVPRSSRCTMPGPQLAADAAEIRDVVEQRVDERARRVAGAGMHDHAGRFVQHREVGVLVEDVEWKRFARRAVDGVAAGHVDADADRLRARRGSASLRCDRAPSGPGR